MIVRELITVLGFKVETEKIKQAEAALGRFRNTTAQVATGAQRAGAQVAMFSRRFLGIAAAGLVARQLFRANMELGRLRVILQSVTGSAAQAAQAFDLVTRFAATTPFQIEEVLEAFIALNAVGVQPNIEMMTEMGDVAAALGTTIDNLIAGVARAAGGRTERLRQVFRTAIESTGNTIGFTFRGVRREAEKTVPGIIELIRQIGREEFAGGMALQMQEIVGVWSNLKDIITIFLFQIGEGGFTPAMINFINLLQEAIKGSKDLAKFLGMLIAVPLKALVLIIKVLTAASGALKFVLGALALGATVGSLRLIIGALRKILGLVTLINAPLIIAVGLLLLVEDFIGFMTGKESVIGAFVEEFAGDDGLLGGISRFLIFMRDNWPEIWEDATQSISDFFKVAKFAVESLVGIFGGLIAAVERIVNTFASGIDAIRTGLSLLERGPISDRLGEIREELEELETERVGIFRSIRGQEATGRITSEQATALLRFQATRGRAGQISARVASLTEEQTRLRQRDAELQEGAVQTAREILSREGPAREIATGLGVIGGGEPAPGDIFGAIMQPATRGAAERAGELGGGGVASILIDSLNLDFQGTPGMTREQIQAGITDMVERGFEGPLRSLLRLAEGTDGSF